MTMTEQFTKAIKNNKKGFALISINISKIGLTFFDTDDETGEYVFTMILSVDESIDSFKFYQLLQNASEVEIDVKHKSTVLVMNKYQ